MLETTAFRFSTFQHFNDFNDSQEGNAVQDSPSSMTLRTSSDSLNVGTINITIFLLVHLIGELHKVYIMTMLILVKSTNLTTINKKMCNTSLTNQQRTLPNNIKDPHSGTFLYAMRINFLSHHLYIIIKPLYLTFQPSYLMKTMSVSFPDLSLLLHSRQRYLTLFQPLCVQYP